MLAVPLAARHAAAAAVAVPLLQPTLAALLQPTLAALLQPPSQRRAAAARRSPRCCCCRRSAAGKARAAAASPYLRGEERGGEVRGSCET